MKFITKRNIPFAAVFGIFLLAFFSCNPEPNIVYVTVEEEGPTKVFNGILMHNYTYSPNGEMQILESWQYGDEEMTQVDYYAVNEYDENGSNNLTMVYNGYDFDAADPLSGYSMYQKFVYQYENNCIVKAEAYDETNTLKEWYVASYNDSGNYTSYIHYEGAGTETIIEHRTATYDASGENYLVETRYFGAEEADSDIKEQWICDYGDLIAEGIYQSEYYYKRVLPSGNGQTADTTSDDIGTEDLGYTEEFIFEYIWEGTEFCIMKNKFNKNTSKLTETIHYTPVVVESEYLMARRSRVVEGEVRELKFFNYAPDGNMIDTSTYLYEGENKTKRLDSETTYEYSSRVINGTSVNIYTEIFYYYTYPEDETRSYRRGMGSIARFKTVGRASER